MVDFIDRKMGDITSQRKRAESDIIQLSRQVDEMEAKIRAYLGDRQRKPHPRHLDLVEKIQGYRLDPNITNKHLVTLLDNLQWKVYYNKRAWKQIWENAEALERKEKMRTGPPLSERAPANHSDGETLEDKEQYSVATLWAIQKDKLQTHGYSESDLKESKPAFKKRMFEEYKQLSSEKKSSQEIVMTFDKDSKRCKLSLKD